MAKSLINVADVSVRSAHKVTVALSVPLRRNSTPMAAAQAKWKTSPPAFDSGRKGNVPYRPINTLGANSANG